MPFLNKKGDGAIWSDTLNVTRITGAAGALIATLAALDKGLVDFSGVQRTVIVVTVIAAIAVISAADILGRGLAIARAPNPPAPDQPAPNGNKLGRMAKVGKMGQRS